MTGEEYYYNECGIINQPKNPLTRGREAGWRSRYGETDMEKIEGR
jgi:hypothetical protein